ncbi:hypothetical protein SH668x_002260 [Planctomicrobium sp. SH668]|uniref:hypothetical protein n=1 Tax=Planctomicrobium sp. SH668 TaxID=3448126 RepID=UPI003F5B8F94
MSSNIQSSSSIDPSQDELTTRVMRILELVRLEKGQSDQQPAEIAVEPELRHCPSCKAPADFSSHLWCTSCFYCPKLGRVIRDGELAGQESGTPRASIPFRRYGKYVIWIPLAVLLVEWVIVWMVPEWRVSPNFSRVQVGSGLLLCSLAHIYLFSQLRAAFSQLPISSLWLEPVQLWVAAFRRPLPNRLAPIAATLGLVLMMAGGVKSGADFHWMSKNVQLIATSAKSKKELRSTNTISHKLTFKNVDIAQSQATSANRDSIAEVSKGANAAASLLSATMNADFPIDGAAEAAINSGNRATCIVFGYLTNSSGDLKSILLAERMSNRYRFVAKLSLHQVDEKMISKLQENLNEIRTLKPTLNTRVNAKWVLPIVEVQVLHQGRGADGLLSQPELIDFDYSGLSSSSNDLVDAKTHIGQN